MERLDLRLVEYFIAVAEELHFGRAAERLHIAQPSLSQQIRRLEAQLGVTLLDRNTRNVELTDAGRGFLREGRKTLRQAQHTIQAARGAGAARLNVGFYGSAADALLADVLRAFREAHPSCVVRVRELLFGSIDDILDGRVDLAFTRLAPGQTELEVALLAEEPRLAALAGDHPLAARDSIAYADLRDETFIVNPMVSGGDEPQRWLSEQRQHGLPGRITEESTSIQEILTLVASGRGVALVPSAVTRQHARPDIAYVPVVDAEPAVVSLVWPRGSLSPAATAFVDTARRIASSA